MEKSSFWNPSPGPDFTEDENTLQGNLDALLHEVVKARLVADVSLGAFLSGGVDSSLVTAIMQRLSPTAIKTFSIGFEEAAYNEAPHAAAVARHLGTDHHQLYVKPNEILQVLPHLAEWYDEPFADSSQLPTYLVSRLARQHGIKVALSGDGGDELFAGYNRYLLAQKLWRMLSNLPYKVRYALGHILKKIPSSLFDTLGMQGHKIAKLASIAQSKDIIDCYQSLLMQWESETPLVQNAPPFRWPYPSVSLEHGAVKAFQLMDLMGYLPDDILVKVDRASMAVGLEAREPLLDHRLVEFAFRLPLSMKIRHGQSKWLLRQVLYQYVPPHLIERPKMGFGIPIGAWLRGPLRAWAEELLSPPALSHGLLCTKSITECYLQHQSGKRDWGYRLWNILMFQLWYSTCFKNFRG